MNRQFMPIEKILAVFGNRYIALDVASLEVRRIIEQINRGSVEMRGSPYYESLRRLIDGEIKYEEVPRKEETPA
jgi:hypothetical protein